MTLWLVRSAKYGERETLALNNNIATIGWDSLPDLSTLPTRQKLYDALEAANPDEKGKSLSAKYCLIQRRSMIVVDGEVLEEIAPHVSGSKAGKQSRIIDALAAVLQSTLEQYEIGTRLRVAHFLAQACHESDGFCTTQEYASGAAYEGRANLGNTQKGDGVKFKGRGLFQLTGRTNYQIYGKALGLDLVANPDIAAEPINSLMIACEYWNRNELSALADNDDLVSITQRINGGQNGIESRREYLTRAKAALVRLEAAAIPSQDDDIKTMPILRRSSKGQLVADLQSRLRAAGYPIAIDGDFGPATEGAVMHFESSKGQKVDGIVGPETWRALSALR